MASPSKKPRLVLNLALGDTSSTSPFNAQDHWLKIHCVPVSIFKHGPPTDVNCTLFLGGSGKIIWHQSIFSDSENRRLIPGIGKNHQKPASIFQFYLSRTESVYLRPSSTTIMLGSQTNLDLCRKNGNQPTKKLVTDHEILELPAGYASWISKSQSGESLWPWFKPLGGTPVSSILSHNFVWKRCPAKMIDVAIADYKMWHLRRILSNGLASKVKKEYKCCPW